MRNIQKKIKISADISEIEDRQMIGKINEIKNLFLENIDKIDKTPGRLIK